MTCLHTGTVHTMLTEALRPAEEQRSHRAWYCDRTKQVKYIYMINISGLLSFYHTCDNSSSWTFIPGRRWCSRLKRVISSRSFPPKCLEALDVARTRHEKQSCQVQTAAVTNPLAKSKRVKPPWPSLWEQLNPENDPGRLSGSCEDERHLVKGCGCFTLEASVLLV